MPVSGIQKDEGDAIELGSIDRANVEGFQRYRLPARSELQVTSLPHAKHPLALMGLLVFRIEVDL